MCWLLGEKYFEVPARHTHTHTCSLKERMGFSCPPRISLKVQVVVSVSFLLPPRNGGDVPFGFPLKPTGGTLKTSHSQVLARNGSLDALKHELVDSTSEQVRRGTNKSNMPLKCLNHNPQSWEWVLTSLSTCRSCFAPPSFAHHLQHAVTSCDP